MHRADECEVIDRAREVRHRVGDPCAAPAMSREPERAPHDRAGALDELDLAGELIDVGLAVILVERGFGIEQIHLTWAAIHEEVNDGLGLGGEVRLPRFGVGRHIGGASGFHAEERRERGTVNATGHALEEFATCEAQSHHSPHSTYRKLAEFKTA